MNPDWRTPTRCTASECAQIATTNSAIHIRDSTNPATTLHFTPATWENFTNRIKNGETP